MSESVRYAARLSGGTGRRLAQALGQAVDGIHDVAAWERARQQLTQVSHGLAEVSAVPVTHGADGPALENPRRAALKRLANELRSEPALMNLVKQVDGSARSLIDGLANMAPVDGWVRCGALVQAMSDRLAVAEHEVLRQTLHECLTGLGYRVKNRGGSLRATLEQTCVWAALDEKDDLHLNLSGFSGLSCLKELERLTRALKAQGVTLERQGSDANLPWANASSGPRGARFVNSRVGKAKAQRVPARRLMMNKGGIRT